MNVNSWHPVISMKSDKSNVCFWVKYKRVRSLQTSARSQLFSNHTASHLTASTRMGKFDGVYRQQTFDGKYGEILRAMGNLQLFYKMSPKLTWTVFLTRTRIRNILIPFLCLKRKSITRSVCMYVYEETTTSFDNSFTAKAKARQL